MPGWWRCRGRRMAVTIAADHDGSTVRLCGWHADAGEERLEAGATAGAADGRRAIPGDEGGQGADGLSAAAARGRSEGAGPHSACGGTGAAHDRKAAARHVESSCCARCPECWSNCLVAEGDEVQEGQALATVEAMKMENILKAERHGRGQAIWGRGGRKPEGGCRDHGV